MKYSFKDFIKDALIKTPQSIAKSPITKNDVVNSKNSIMMILRNVSSEIIESKGNYINRFKRELEEISEINKNAANIKTPIIIISGEEDSISERKYFMPKDEEDRLKEKFGELPISDIREHYLKENLFMNSPYIRMISPTKYGTHSLPFFKPKSIANISKGLLDRYYRNKKTLIK